MTRGTVILSLLKHLIIFKTLKARVKVLIIFLTKFLISLYVLEEIV